MILICELWPCFVKMRWHDIQYSSVQLLSRVWLFVTPWATRSTPGLPSLTPGVYSNSCPSSQLCYPAISSSVVPFSCPQSLPASGSFPMSQLFEWGSQSIGVSASASVLPVNTQDWSPLGWTGCISLKSKGLSRVFSNTTAQKHQFMILILVSYWYSLSFEYHYLLKLTQLSTHTHRLDYAQ